MLDIDDAIASTTTISPGKLSLGEGSGGTATLRLTNSGSSPVTYDLADVAAISTGAQTFAPLVNDFWLPDTTVTFSSPSVTVPAGGSATVGVTIAADPLEDGIPTNGLYGGYLVFTDRADADSVYRVPYLGFKGDYQSIVAMPNAPVIGKRNAPFEKGPQTYVAAAANEVWTLASPDEVPNVLIHLDHQARRLELQVVDAASGKPLHPVFSNYLERDWVAQERHAAAGRRAVRRRRERLRVPVGRDADARQRQGHGEPSEARAGWAVQDRRPGAEGARRPGQPGRLGGLDLADDHDRPALAGSIATMEAEAGASRPPPFVTEPSCDLGAVRIYDPSAWGRGRLRRLSMNRGETHMRLRSWGALGALAVLGALLSRYPRRGAARADAATKTYIVQMLEAPVVAYEGGVAGHPGDQAGQGQEDRPRARTRSSSTSAT